VRATVAAAAGGAWSVSRLRRARTASIVANT
jgi:hypothetical protein